VIITSAPSRRSRRCFRRPRCERAKVRSRYNCTRGRPLPRSFWTQFKKGILARCPRTPPSWATVLPSHTGDARSTNVQGRSWATTPAASTSRRRATRATGVGCIGIACAVPHACPPPGGHPPGSRRSLAPFPRFPRSPVAQGAALPRPA
jgi:hypothetical protein